MNLVYLLFCHIRAKENLFRSLFVTYTCFVILHLLVDSAVSIAVIIIFFFLEKYLELSIQLLIFATVNGRKNLDETTSSLDKIIINEDKTKSKFKRTSLQ